MVRFVKYKNKEYIVVTTTFQVDDVEAPVQIQINLENIDKQHHSSFFRQASFLLNRPLKLAKPQKQESKSWWKRLFGTK